MNTMKLSDRDWRRILPKLCAVFCLVLTAVLLWRWQRLFFLMCTDGRISDMPGHIKLALGNNDYGLSSFLIRFLYSIGDAHFAQTALSLCLAANMLLGIVTLWLLIARMFPELDKWYALLASLLAHICAPWIFPGQTKIYLGVFNGNVLHNMTLLFSRSFIPLDFLFFFDCWDSRHGKIPFPAWAGLCISFVITTLFKPNFAFAFIPMLGVLLLVDLIRYKGKYIKNEIILGMTVVPAGIACIWQYLTLFSGSFAGTSSSVALRALGGAELAALIIMYIRSSLLPIFTLSVQLPEEKSEREHIGLVLLCLAVAVAEACIFTETGYRATDGNFEWGSLSIYPVFFAISIALLFRLTRRAAIGVKREKLLTALGYVLLLGHLLTGVYCLYQARTGGYYWFYF